MASLLEIHAAALEQMNAPQLQQFFDTIASSPADWFTALTTAATATTAASATTVGTTTTSTTGSASSFTEAWIHATTGTSLNPPPPSGIDSLTHLSVSVCVSLCLSLPV